MTHNLTYIQQRQQQKLGLKPTAAEEKRAQSKKQIPKKSAKRVIEDKEYTKEAKEYLKAHPGCEAHVATGCTGKSQEIHHKSRRNSKEDRISPENFLAICRPCHLWVSAHPKQAIELGLSDTAIKPKKKP